jgi:hypothetical protein
MPTSDLKYVGINPTQLNFGKKSLLYSEMELLTGIKHFQTYRKLRKKEFSIKNLLRKTISALKEEIKNLELFLPDVPQDKDSLNISKGIKKRDTLEKEIEDLRLKIANLQ